MRLDVKTKADSIGVGFDVLEDLVSVELEDFHVLESLSIYHHPDKGDLLMETRVARRARVDVEQVEFLVIDNL